jgi:hypothetical protein
MMLAIGLALPAVAQFGARGAPVGTDGVISPTNLDPGETWPLTIPRATFVCEGEAVFLSDGKTQYPLNGHAKTLAGTHPENRRPLEDVWLPDEKVIDSKKRGAAAVDMVRVNITPVLDRGVRWCRERQKL